MILRLFTSTQATSAFFVSAIFCVLFITPNLVGAVGQNTGGASVQQDTGGGSVGLTNPLSSPTLMGFLQELLDVIMVFAIPLIVFMIIYAGFMYVTAQGDAKKVSDAHNALLYAVIGGVIILGANVILAVISGTVDAFR